MRGLAAAAILACAALGFAGPAHADQVMQGIYNYTPQEGDSGTLTIYPSCVPVVGDLRVNLDLPVALPAARVPVGRLTGGDAILTGGLWQFTSPKKDGMQCPDGSSAPTVETIKFDDVLDDGHPQHQPQRRLRSAARDRPHPVHSCPTRDRCRSRSTNTPLYCEPGGLRRASKAELIGATAAGQAGVGDDQQTTNRRAENMPRLFSSVGRRAGQRRRTDRASARCPAAQRQGRRPDRPAAHGSAGVSRAPIWGHR